MGKEFGKLNRIVGITYFTLSPHEQKALKGIFNPGLLNTLRRFRENLFLFGIPIATCYAIIATATDMHDKAMRKNPDDYKNDT